MNISNDNVNYSLQNGKKQQNKSSLEGKTDRAELMNKIQALAFAKTETELYLDGHPEATAALDYYKELILRLRNATEEYEAKYGPLTAGANIGDKWEWTLGAWPWQYNSEGDL